MASNRGLLRESKVTFTCECGTTTEHEQWCRTVPRLVTSPDLYEGEGRRLLFESKFRLSEFIGFVKTVRPDLESFVQELEIARDDVSSYLRIERPKSGL